MSEKYEWPVLPLSAEILHLDDDMLKAVLVEIRANVRAAVEAALRDAPHAEGWVMVPVEPTQTMMQQGKHALYEESMGDFDASLLEIKATYRAMLAARPSAPTAVEPDDQRYQLLRRGQHWSVIDGVGDVLRGDDLDAAVDSILATRASKGTPL